MEEKVYINKINEVHMHVSCDRGTAYTLSEHFSFYVPGYKFMPKYRGGVWDGKIRLFDVRNNTIYIGLLNQLKKFLLTNNFPIEISSDFDKTNTITVDEVYQFANKIQTTLTPYDYQAAAVAHAINSDRVLFLSPTASGKSFIIYLLTRFYKKPTLIVVPTIALVHQMTSDFESYGFDSEKYVYKIHAGVDKEITKPIVITTWQSIFKLKKSWFDQFDLIIGDEAHLFKAQSLVGIMEKAVNIKYRFGFTGTLDGSLTNKMVLEGLFGSLFKVTTTAEMIDKKRASPLKIKCLVLKYEDESLRKLVSKMKYKDEFLHISSSEKRNKFIANLAVNLKGNTLILFQYIEKQGDILYNMLKEMHPDRSIFYIHGQVDGLERDQMRKVIENEENAIIVASFGTTSTGINIKRLHNIIFASPSKARVKNLQSIGRGLRLSEHKDVCTLYDISDDFSWKSSKNHTLNHFIERIKIYSEEKFDYEIHNIKM